ncbi:DUF6318 family protein, partial [Actinomyces sp. 187325]
VLGALIGTGLHHLADQADDPQPRHTPITSGYSPQPTTPTPSPSVQPSLSAEEQALKDAALTTPAPERPEGMDEFTPEGAMASVEYFLNLVPYIHATGDLSDWQAMSSQDCGFCTNGVNEATALHQDGGWWDPWQQETTVTGYGPSTEDDTIWVVAVTVSYPESMKHDGAGGTSPIQAAQENLLIQVHWTGQSWVVQAGQTV